MPDADPVWIRLVDVDRIQNFENALGHVEAELDVTVIRDGEPGAGEVTLERAVAELATAYAGVDLRDLEDDDPRGEADG